MEKKQAKAILDEHAPGWAGAAVPAHHIKATTDPKFRMVCLEALAAHGPVKPAKISKTKAKPKGKATTTSKK
jgi:hypothetical protein